MRNELLVNSITIRTQVCCVDSIGVVVVWSFMTECYHDELGCWSLCSGVGCRNDTSIPGCRKVLIIAVVVSTFSSWPMALVVDDRVSCLLIVGVVTSRKYYVGSNVHVATPKLAQLLASDLDMLECVCVFVVALVASANLLASEILNSSDVVESQFENLPTSRYLNVLERCNQTSISIDIRRAIATWKTDRNFRTVAPRDCLVASEKGLHTVGTRIDVTQANIWPAIHTSSSTVVVSA